MSRFFAPAQNVKGNLIHIDGQEARHILNAMRLKEGDKVVVFDGTGKEYTGFIKETKPRSLLVEVVSVRTAKKEELPEITLAQALPKKEKMAHIVEKATELGARRIIPVISERTVVRSGVDRISGKIARWKKIAIAAAKQCGRADVPEINCAQKFYNLIETVNDFDLALIACLSDNTQSMKQAISGFGAGKIIVFIGPEGDFTPDEIKMAENTSCKLVSLGRRVLKSDTAGLYILSVLNHELSR